jgi:hypothetical protein
MKLATLRRAVPLVLAAAGIAPPLAATWSILVVNTKTGEVAVGCATCIAGMDIQEFVPAVVPGIGVGAAQCSGDNGAVRRMAMVAGLLAGLTPAEIITSGASEQNGIVDLLHDPVTWTGPVCQAGKLGVTGIAGDLRYAIQGNVLAGKKVVKDAEAALLATPGDLAEKLMAAMEAASGAGGDGRCSCSYGSPNSCGSPPPSFTHSAYNGSMVVARVGDTLGVCNGTQGCANGSYYLSLSVVSGPNKPPPIPWLRSLYDAWRAGQAGRPDAIHSLVDAGADSLVADGQARMPVSVRLFDIDGNPLPSGGALVSLVNDSGAPAVTLPGPVLDHGDGSYSFELEAQSSPGTDLWRIVVDDHTQKPVSLYPPLAVRVDPLAPLHVGRDQVSASQGGWVPLTVNQGTGGAFYRVLGSTSGVQPGSPFQGTVLPLNRDPFMTLTATRANTALLPGTRGFLDAAGRAEAAFAPPPGLLEASVGGRVEWSVIFRDASGTSVAPAAGFDVLP